MRTHYDTLGVSNEATKQEIKEVYRRLCIETHPDLAKSSKSRSTERFKEISHAYSVLGHEVKRREYDGILKQQLFTWKNDIHRQRNKSTGQGHYPLSSLHRAVFQLPRNLLIGCTLGFATASFAKYFFSNKVDDNNKDLVEAWKNPKTGQWEQPVPWDEYYQKLQPEICSVPRHVVQKRSR